MPLPFAAFHRRLHEILDAAPLDGTTDQNGVFLPSGRADIRCVGFALEPDHALLPWVERERIDALFLHRPWGLTDAQRRDLAAADIGVLAYHLAFDERLTTGFNPALARACGWLAPERLGEKMGRPLGMACALPQPVAAFGAVAENLRAVFGGLDDAIPPSAAGNDAPVARAAVVGAMTDALVREAHACGVGLYATGQWRQPARAAVRETGIGVVVIGHRRSEEWGLRTLGDRLRADGLDARFYPSPGQPLTRARTIGHDVPP